METIKKRMYTAFALLALGNSLFGITPEELLKDNEQGRVFATSNGTSVYVRKGSIAATLKNVKRLNELLAGSAIAQSEQQEFEKLVQEISELIPGMQALEVFDVLTPLECLQDARQPGKIVLGILYFKAFPADLNDEVCVILQTLKTDSHSAIKTLVDFEA